MKTALNEKTEDRDRTDDRHKTKDQSRIGEDRIREAFEFAASGMAITDLEGRFKQTNSAYRAIVSRNEMELDGETILSLTHEADQPRCKEQLDQLVSGQIPSFVLEKRYVRPNLEAIWVRNSFSLLRGGSEKPTHIILICHDVTEKRRAERMLIETEKLTVAGQLAASIAHEISNPLEGVINLLYLVRNTDEISEAHELARQAEDEIQRVAKIATDTLRFHQHDVEPAMANISELIDPVLALFKGRLNEARIKVALDKKDSPDMLCFPGEIRQVLANLVRNAVQAMPNGGKLRLRVRPATDWRTATPGVRVTMSDTGSGISAETRKRIYDPFFTTKGNQGTGLGLWVTSQILAKHSGSMHLRSSEKTGKSGTAFTLIFPKNGAEGKTAGLGDLS